MNNTDYLVVGSRALAYWGYTAAVSKDSDWDVVGHTPLYLKTARVEMHNPNELLNDLLINYTSQNDVVVLAGVNVRVVNLTGLRIMKRSHLWRTNLKFSKHMTHYCRYLKDAPMNEHDRWLLEARTALTMQAYPQGTPSLNKSVEAFFDDAVTKVYSHDYLHELFAYEDKPLYTKLQYDANKAWCEKDLWQNLSHQQKVQCVAEEVQVIATERFMVPNDWKYPSKLAFMKALEKVCTNLCSGWFRDFALDHYEDVLLMYNSQKFNDVKFQLERK
jgi:hypothetical protein